MKYNNISKYLIALLGASMLMVGCQKELLQRSEAPSVESPTTERGEGKTDAHIIPGQVVVKLKPADLKALRSAGESSLRAASSDVQQSLREVGAVSMEPLFADYEAYRERRHKAGLDRWMLVTFEGQMSSRQAQHLLGETGTFEYVELKYAMASPQATAVPVSNKVALRAGANGPFNDPLLPRQWHYFNTGATDMPQSLAGADINLNDAWQIETGRPEVVVCVVDAGVDYEHEDLAAHVDLDRSFSFVIDRNTQRPKGAGQIESKSSAHGTHVAGTIAAVNNNGIGVAGVAGGNGEPGTGVTLINAQIFGAKGERTMAGVNGIVYGADHGAVISQNSWGYIAPGPKQLSQYDKEAMDYFIEYAGCDENGNQRPDSPMKGGVIIFAAGNDGLEYNNYPGAYEGCISVASSGWGFRKAYYSNFGAFVDITAPGGDQDFGQSAGVLSTLPGNRYGYMQGTSMACPHVSGVAALVVSKFGGQGFTNEMLKKRLLTALRPYDIYSMNIPMLKDKMGVGYIDATIALIEDGRKAPAVVAGQAAEASYTTADITWIPSADEDAPNKVAYYYNIYVGQKEITASGDKSAKVYKVYADGRTKAEKLHFLVTNLTDDTSYHYAIEAVDYFGNKSAQLTKGTFKTLKNAAPVVTEGLPKEVIKVANNQNIQLKLKVQDADNHKWAYQLNGDLYGVKHKRAEEYIEIEIAPIQTVGIHKLTLLLTDEYGKSSESVISYEISKYQALMPAKNLSEQSISVGQQGTVDLAPLFKSQPGATITYQARSERSQVMEVSVKGNQLTYQAKGKGRVIVLVTATDGFTTAQVPLHYRVR